MAKLRTIVKEARFEQELASIEPDVERADDFLEGVETILSRDPQCGHRLGESHVHFIPGWTVDLNIYYTFNDDEVFLLSICRMAPPAP
jgi:hypothetical protein